MRSRHTRLTSLSISILLTLSSSLSMADQLQQIRQLADQGDIKAQSHLGYVYYVGEGVSQDYVEAVKWYRKAAAQGDRDAQYNLAVAYAFGEGVKQDFTQAATWYRRAAEQSHKIAQYSLGLSYAYGEGVPQDSKEAAKWFEKSALQGYSRAQVHLASMYHIGDGVSRNFAEAAKWYRKAADRGDPTAQYNLGSLYRSGKGVKQDVAQAKRWFRLAADQGYAPAQNELASLNFKPKPSSAPVVTLPESQNALAQQDKSIQTATASPANEATVTPESTPPVEFVEQKQVTEKVVSTTPEPVQKETATTPAAAKTLVNTGEVAVETGTTVTDTASTAVAESTEKSGGLFGFFGKLFEPKEQEDELTAEETNQEPINGFNQSTYAADTHDDTSEERIPASFPVLKTHSSNEVASEEVYQAEQETVAAVEEISEEPLVSETETAATEATFENESNNSQSDTSVEQDIVSVIDEPEATTTVTADETELVADTQAAEEMVKQEADEPSFFQRLFGTNDEAETEPLSSNEIATAEETQNETETVFIEHNDSELAEADAEETYSIKTDIAESDFSEEAVDLLEEDDSTVSNETAADWSQTEIIQKDIAEEAINTDDQISLVRDEDVSDENDLLTESDEIADAETPDPEETEESGIGGFFSRLFGNEDAGTDEEIAATAESESVPEEVKEYVDGLETDSPLVTADETETETIAAVESETVETKSLQPPPVTDAEFIPESGAAPVEQLALSNDAKTQLELADSYYMGKDIPQDYEQALTLYRNAAEQGEVDAQYKLGNMYLLGEGVSQDNHEAYRWYHLAAEQGHPSAQNNVESLERVFKQQGINQTDVLAANETVVEKNIQQQNMPKAESGLPSFIDELFVAGEKPAEAEQTQTDTPPLQITETEETVATIYPLEDEITQDAEPLPKPEAAESETNDLAATANETTKSGSLFDKLFDSSGSKEGNEQTTSETSALPAVALKETSAEDEENLNALFNESFNQQSSSVSEETSPPAEIEPVPEVAVTYPAEEPAEIDVVDFSSNDELNAIHTEALNGDADAQYRLGNMYLMGEGIEQNDQEALRWYELAANSGHESAQHNYKNLQKMIASASASEATNNEDSTTAEISEEVAEIDEADADPSEESGGLFSSIKNLFASDESTLEETPESVTDAKDTSDEIVQIEETNNSDKEKEQIAESISSTDSETQIDEAVTTESFVAEVVEEEESLVFKSETQTDSVAEENYQQGLAYSYGDNVETDPQMAFGQFLKAANKDHTAAQYRVATAYAYGEGVTQDFAQAAAWYRKAAEKGDPLAQRQLAKLYWSGKGVKKDRAMAHAWYSIIASSGDQMDQQRLNNIQQEMTSEELDKSRRISEELDEQLHRL